MATQEAVGKCFAVWTTPVHLDVGVESGAKGDPSASAGDVLAAVIETPHSIEWMGSRVFGQ